MEPGEFHWKDGIYFKRLQDGSVRLRITETAQADSPTAREEVIPPNEWGSIVSHVSATGETSESWQTAVRFHGVRPGEVATAE